MKIRNLYGLVLAGGRSERMGFDKAAIWYHGVPQLEYVFHALSSVCERTFTSCRTGQPTGTVQNPLEDSFGIAGPANGVLSAFARFPGVAWLTAPVDMPNVDEIVLQHLCQARNKEKVATCFFNESAGIPEPLVTIWEPSAFPLLKSFVSGGKASLRAFLQQHDVNMVIPGDARIFENINSEDQYRSFRRPEPG